MSAKPETSAIRVKMSYTDRFLMIFLSDKKIVALKYRFGNKNFSTLVLAEVVKYVLVVYYFSSLNGLIK